MKILMLHSSGRKNGFTGRILDIFKEKTSVKHDPERINLNNMNIKPCSGCLKCRPDKVCALPEDDGHRIAKKIGEANALILASPTYYGNMSGSMKTLFDRVLPVLEYIPVGKPAFPKQLQKGKKAVIITASNAPWPYNLLPSQSRGAVRAMKTVLKCGGYRIIGILNLSGAGLRKEIPTGIIRKVSRLVKKI